MTDKPVRIPGPDHPIAVTNNPKRVVVTANGTAIADTRNALTLREANYPPVHYIPRTDTTIAAFERSDHSTYCPYKGDASFSRSPASTAATMRYGRMKRPTTRSPTSGIISLSIPTA